MRKPLPINPADAGELGQWAGQTRGLLGELREVALDATAPHRVHSRKELRRRATKLSRRLGALLEALHPAAGMAPAEGAASEAPPSDEDRAPDSV